MISAIKLKTFAAAALAAALVFLPDPSLAQPPQAPPFSTLQGSGAISATSTSSRLALPAGVGPNSAAVTLYNGGTKDAYFKAGTSSVVATTSPSGAQEGVIRAGTFLTFWSGASTHVAAITAGSDTTTIDVYQGSGPIQFGKAGGSGGGAPSGPAGGDLAGTYPNPTVANLSGVTNASLPNTGLANSSVTIAGHVVALGGSQTLQCSDLTNAGVFCSGTDAAGLTGTVAAARLTGAYGGITGVGTLTNLSVGAGSAITSSGSGGALTALAYTAPGTGVATALGNTAGGAGGFALVGTTPPTGSAGGSLAGTYPNPSLASVNSVGTSLAVAGCTIGTDALCWTGTATGSGRLSAGGTTNTGNGAASVSSLLLNGTLFTGGSGTTTFPQIFVQPTGTTAATTWSTSGTIIGANVVSGFAGNFLDFHVAGATSVFKVTSAGAATFSGTITGPDGGTWSSTGIASPSFVGISNNSGTMGLRNGSTVFSSPANASWQLGLADVDTNAAIVAQVIRSQGALTGGTADQAGKNLTVIVSPGKGTGAGGAFVVQTTPAGSTGTAVNAPVTALTIDSTGLATFAAGVVGASFAPTGSSAPANGMYLGGTNQINFSTNSVSRLLITTTSIRSATGSASAMLFAAPSATVPGFAPNASDLTTGIGAQASGNISLIAGGVEQMRIAASGALTLPLIPSDTAQTDSTMCVNSSGVVFKGTGTIGICLGTSSARFKSDIEPLEVGLAQIMAVRPVRYRVDAQHGDPDKVLYGFTAEQAGAVIPALMGRDDAQRPNTFDYLGMVPVLVRAVQELKADNDNLRQELRQVRTGTR